MLSDTDSHISFDLNELVVSDSGMEFTGEAFRSVLSWGVYAFFDKAQCLYVGMSRHVLSRASQDNHRQADLAREGATTVRLWACPSERAATDLESLLIAKWKPKYNKNKWFSYLGGMLGVNSTRRNKLRGVYAIT